MTIISAWDNREKTIYRHEVIRSFDWSEYDAAADETWAAIRTVDHIVDVIVITPPGISMPKGVPMSHLKRAFLTQPPNLGVIVFVGLNLVFKTLSKILIRLYPPAGRHVRFAASLADAYAILAALRAEPLSTK